MAGTDRSDGPSSHLARGIAAGAGLLALVLTGAIAGFFYAYSASVLQGLDVSDPRDAIAAMQGINATIRNPGFGISFFGAPLATLIAAGLFLRLRRRAVALAFLIAALLYVTCALLPTLLIHVPMNDALAQVAIPADREQALRVWAGFADPWDSWNLVRTIASLASLLLVGVGLLIYREFPSPRRR
ncbi:Uncharacterized membrane protein [Tistlia consotensis]|uniref:Uncharacterized membrane protein n=1 Tax=Tistlia consotensis USBA 355 TaxID=560819 RepID=A0A1Y6BI77_9PROT|nr:anthrone oxygenase family protein [Tistlia consotensis]SMF13049.1 Uncharacterized membrane protein [Tistlia consotensis USBA 355]SNR50754.1 Uncharacterized membrane protein [Tistlia consotensis]